MPPDPTPELPVISGETVTLRRPEERDVAARQRAGRDPGLVRGFGDDPATAGPLTREDAERWYRQASSDPAGWVIDVGGDAVGMARLDLHPHATGTARYAIGIWRADLRGRGLGVETTRLVLEHAFRALGLHRVELRVLARNHPAVRCYERCGFRVEGRLREVLFDDGAWQDELLMGILAHEHPPAAPR